MRVSYKVCVFWPDGITVPFLFLEEMSNAQFLAPLLAALIHTHPLRGKGSSFPFPNLYLDAYSMSPT